jgi:TPR repeat protein
MPTTDNDASPESLFEAGKKFYFPNQYNTHDPDLAMLYFQKAASGGYAPAQRLYGICLLEGNFCQRDLEGAVRYLTLASEKHDPQASYTLALLHAKGEGVPKDWWKAYELLSHPSVQGLAEARALKIKLKQELLLLYPALVGALEKEEIILRSRLEGNLKRTFPLFWNRLEDDSEEFRALLGLNLKKMTPEEALAALKDMQERYYRPPADRG